MRQFSRLSDFEKQKGEILGTSKWVTVSQEMMTEFARLTGDEQWIHLDRKRTLSELGSEPFAHGFLLVSLLPQLQGDVFEILSLTRAINFGANKIRFLKPVTAGTRVRAKVKLKRASIDKNFLRAIFETEFEADGTEGPVMFAETIALFYEDMEDL